MESAVKAAVLYKANTPLEVVESSSRARKAGEARVQGQGRGHLPQRLAHHERRLDAAAAHGAGPRGGRHRGGGRRRASPTSSRATTSSSRSARSAGAASTARSGRSILCDGHTLAALGHARRHLSAEAQGPGHLPDGAHRHLLRAGGVPGRDAGADPQGDAVAAGGAGRLLRADGRRRRHPLRGGGGGRLGPRHRLRRRGAQRRPGRAAGRGRHHRRLRPARQQARPTPRSSARPTPSMPRATSVVDRVREPDRQGRGVDYAFDAIGGEADHAADRRRDPARRHRGDRGHGRA